MPSIITLDGARARRLADAWSDDATPGSPSALGQATSTFLLWGAVAFAASTAAIRGWRAVSRFAGSALDGAPRRRRRRR